MLFKKKNKQKTTSKHTHIGKDEIEGGDIQKIISPLWFSVSIYDGEYKYNQDLKPFSLPQRYIFAIEWYIAEVNNGGHDQFYFNSTGIVWKDALKGFEEIKHTKAHNILKESIQRFDETPSMDRSARQNQLDKHNPDFSDLDSNFYMISDIDNLIMKYIKENEKDFYFDGDIS